jgi:hypothetical protein
MLKVATILALVALSGCAGQSIKEMRDEALVSGDWSKVEAYEARELKQAQYDAASRSCKRQSSKLTLVCSGTIRDPGFDVQQDCSCMNVSRTTFGLNHVERRR